MLTKAEFLKQSKIAKRYGNHTGRRFARVVVDGWYYDVMTRSERGGSEQTRVAPIKEMAWNRYQADRHVVITDAQIYAAVYGAFSDMPSEQIERLDEFARVIRDKYERELSGLREVYARLYKQLEEQP